MTTTSAAARETAPARRRSGAVVLAFAAVSVLWGSTYLGIRVALESFPPFFIGAVRFFVAGAVLFVVARVRRERSPTPVEWISACATGLLFFVVGNGFVNLSERVVSSGLVSVLVATMPLWASVFARLFGEPLSRAEAAGIVLGLLGVAVLNVGGELRATPTGALLGLLAPMGWALGSMVSRRVPAPAGIMRTAAPMLTGGAAMFVVSLAVGEHVSAIPSLRSVAAVVYLCVFGSVVGFSAFSYLLSHTRPAVATSYAYVNPVIAVLLGIVFAGEHIGAESVLGAVVVLVAVVVVGRART
ncbi:MAG TPA: drug/metabolite exporter YedA [Polyangiaceae bacterium]|nr:drug/metabolite exporter YedA [Polyangiaceae bacterium]